MDKLITYAAHTVVFGVLIFSIGLLIYLMITNPVVILVVVGTLIWVIAINIVFPKGRG